jgi:hypothetical protein
MASGQTISSTTLDQWATNFRNNKNLPFPTNWGAVSLSELENFITAVKAYASDVNGMKIYFVRYPFESGQSAPSHIQKMTDTLLSQPSMVIVPLKNYDPSSGSGDQVMIPGTDTLRVLAFCEPGDPEDTVLCPPKCG